MKRLLDAASRAWGFLRSNIDDLFLVVTIAYIAVATAILARFAVIIWTGGLQ